MIGGWTLDQSHPYGAEQPKWELATSVPGDPLVTKPGIFVHGTSMLLQMTQLSQSGTPVCV